MSELKRDDGLDHSLVMPYMTGVYLGINAIRDAYLVVDGPNCVFFRTAQIQGNHDWHSSLVECTGLHRVIDTDCTTERAAAGDQDLLRSRLQQVDAIDACHMILLTAMSPVAVTAPQYDKVLKSLPRALSKPVIQVRSGSLSGDWLHGYAALLASLASGIELQTGTGLDDDEVAIVGYLMDRNESDHTANLDELTRLLAGIGLRVTSFWLGGKGVSDLAAAGRAGTILALPYGRNAASLLAGRTGARLVECGLPIGPEATCEWLLQIGKATGREDRARVVIDEHMRRVVPRLEWILPHAFVNKRIAMLGSDPFLIKALSRVLGEFGCRQELVALFSHKEHVDLVTDELGDDVLGAQFLYNPGQEELRKVFEKLQLEESLDLALCNSRVLPLLAGGQQRLPFMELGFPSYYTHALYDSPFMGFSGTLRLIERMANTMSNAAALPAGSST